MRVLSLHAGADTGGLSWALSQAFRNHPDIDLRSAVKQTNYIQYDHDLPWDHVQGFGQYAHVIHLHNTFRTALLTGLAGKPKVLHHHGTHYRDNADRLNAEVQAAEAVAVVSTLDLLDYGPNLTWVPHPYDLPALSAMKRSRSRARSGLLRVGHAPTDRAIKSTDAFLAACAKIPDIQPVLIEGKSWRECLIIKATCDVYFDQVTLGYGCNAIEAWGMGIPVIAGAQPSTIVSMYEQFGHLPFARATEATIGYALDQMLDDDTRQHYGALGAAHVQRWHDGTETGVVLTPIYQRLAQR
jgi:hypothetical protein